MRLENTFAVEAAPERAWALLNDVPAVVPCMPGAELTEVVGDDAWKARLGVRLGPISMTFAVEVAREEVDEAARRVVLVAKAREVRGRGGADARLESSLEAAEAGTRVSVVTDVSLRGAVAQYGRGVVADVASQLTHEFAACIGSRLRDEAAADGAGAVEHAAPSRPISGGQLLARAVMRRVLRLLRPRTGESR